MSGGLGDSADIQASQAISLVGVQVQLGEIKGILQTVVTEHARRLGTLDDATKQLRVDLTSVKEEAQRAIAALDLKYQQKWDDASRQGIERLERMNKEATTAEGRIKENTDDIKEIKDKQNNSWTRTALVLSPIIAVAALLWNIYVNYHH